MLLTDDSCKSNLVLFPLPCRETELPSFSIICRVSVSLYRIIIITLNFLSFLAIWKHHWESKAVPSIEPSLVFNFAICFSTPCYKELLIVNVQHYSHGSLYIRAYCQQEENLIPFPTTRDGVSSVKKGYFMHWVMFPPVPMWPIIGRKLVMIQ